MTWGIRTRFSVEMNSDQGEMMYQGMKSKAGILGVVLATVLLMPASAQAATADLSVSTTDTPDPVVEGGQLTYSITATNNGPEAASGVVVRNELSSQVTFVSATSSQGDCELTGKTVRCSLGVLAVGDATVTIRVTTKKAGQITNRSSISLGASDTDPVASNDVDVETTTVSEPPGGGGGGGGGPTCSGAAVTILGTGGADVLVGTSGRDVIKARGGNDQIRGLGGKDLVCAGGGNDRAKGGIGNDRLKGGPGRDRLKGGAGNDGLLGGPGRDSCKGGPGQDAERSC
jgi:uncharacterized repeat protein (TIGR01451 family)